MPGLLSPPRLSSDYIQSLIEARQQLLYLTRLSGIFQPQGPVSGENPGLSAPIVGDLPGYEHRLRSQ